MVRFFDKLVIFIPLSMVFCFMLSLIVFYFTALAGYNSYWTAIDRVRNIDVNIISSSFPVAASVAISQNRYDFLDAMVNSNSSNFGIAIDKCLNENCLVYQRVASNIAVDKPSFSEIEIPVFHEGYIGDVKVFYERSFSAKPTYVDYDKNKIIGRILINKPIPPRFEDDILLFLERFIERRDFAARYIAYRHSIWLSLSVLLLVFSLNFIIRLYYLNLIARRRIAENMKKRLEMIRSIGK